MRKGKRSPLNVRSFMEEWIDFVDACEGGKTDPIKAHIPPAVWQGMVEFRMVARAILRKHAAKGTRKDIYVERKHGA